MSEKISLDKNHSEIQEINKKLDFLIGEVANIKGEMSRLQSKNEEQIYKLDSRIYHVCSDLKEHIYKLQSAVYDSSSKLSDSHYRVQKEIEELQNQTTYSKFIDRFLPWSPLIAGGGVVWFIFMYKLLHG